MAMSSHTSLSEGELACHEPFYSMGSQCSEMYRREEKIRIKANGYEAIKTSVF